MWFQGHLQPQKKWGQGRDGGVFSRYSKVLNGYGSCVSGGINNE